MMKKIILLFFVGVMGLFGQMSRSAMAQDCQQDTVAWGEGISNGLCWTVQDSTWSVNVFYATISNSATPAKHWLLTPWFEVPSWAATDPVGLIWYARAVKNADLMVLATADGETYDTLFDGLIYPSDNNYSTSQTANPVTHTVLLDAYAGQVMRLAFVYQTGSSRFSLTTGYMRLDLIDFELRTVMHPVALLTVPGKAFTHEATRLSATLSEGSNVGLNYSWYSQLMDTTFFGDTVDITYNTEGMDTIMMVASNIYAADTHWVALPVYDCPPVTARPWIVDWENDFDCWRQVVGSAWRKGYYNSTAILYGENSSTGIIVSPKVVVSTDTAGLRLEW